MVAKSPLRILHVLRAPVGGLFRHVVDLSRAQAERGHMVGLIADETTGGNEAAEKLAHLAPLLKLGVSRVPMSRHLGWRDIGAIRHVTARATAAAADVLHGHGAKGGAFARLAGGKALKVYTPHGGSLHYSAFSPLGFIYLALERMLARRTDLFLFESAYSRDIFHDKVGHPKGLVRVVHNGISKTEFERIEPDADASDIVFVGELRPVKGVNVLIDSIVALNHKGRRVNAVIVGDGPDQPKLQAQARSRGIENLITFAGRMPARTAFRRGKLLVVPSYAESLPYIVLEAIAAGIPLLTTRVGGIPEIYGPNAAWLLPAGDAEALAAAIANALDEPSSQHAASKVLQARVQEAFTINAMTDAVLAAYEYAREKSGGIQFNG